jgi:hypothetical protein
MHRLREVLGLLERLDRQSEYRAWIMPDHRKKTVESLDQLDKRIVEKLKNRLNPTR